VDQGGIATNLNTNSIMQTMNATTPEILSTPDNNTVSQTEPRRPEGIGEN